MKKKICSIFLVLALLAASQTALAVPNWDGAAADLEISGEVAVPPEASAMLADAPLISVRVAASSWVIANPYGMDIARDGVYSSSEIVSPVLTLENQSEVPIRVDARVVGRIPSGSEVTFVQSPPAPDTAYKELFLYAEFQPLRDTGAEAPWRGAFRDASNQLLVTDSGLSKDGLMELEAAGEAYSLGAMQIFGSLAAAPDEPWQEADRFSVNVAFTFTAAAEAAPVSAGLPEMEPYAAPEEAPEPVPEEDAAEEALPEEPDFAEPLPDEGFSDGEESPDTDQSEDAAGSTAE